mgnify:CR=1 FL=1
MIMLLHKNKKKNKIVITAGGTGGHVFPALSLAEELIRKKNNVVFIFDPRVRKIIFQNKHLFKKKFIKYYSLNISKNLKYIFTNFLSLIRAIFILKKEKPNLIVGFGGYTSFVTLISAKILLKPIILHEQNISIGLINKLFLPISRKIILGMGDKNNLNVYSDEKYVFIRNPVRKSILNLRKRIRFNFNKKKIVILIIGGSQGAMILGTIIPEVINLIPEKIRKRIFVYHQCSEKNFKEIKSKYISMNIKANCKIFFNNLPEIMFKSNLVISRAGASSISEITALGRPAILIPYKFAKNNHQLKNAKWFASKGAGTFFEEKDLNIEVLKRKIVEFLSDFEKLKKMSKLSYLLADTQAQKKISQLINEIKK